MQRFVLQCFPLNLLVLMVGPICGLNLTLTVQAFSNTIFKPSGKAIFILLETLDLEYHIFIEKEMFMVID